MLTACPRCDYDLTGLPESHNCPECGCPYDAHSTSIRLTGRRSQYGWSSVTLMLLALPYVNRALSGSRSALVWVVALVSLTIAGLVILTLRRAGLPTRLVVYREGIELITPGQEPLRWRWDEMADAGVGRFSGRFWINGHDGASIFSRYYTRLGRLATARQCAIEINNALRRYKSVAVQTEPHGSVASPFMGGA